MASRKDEDWLGVLLGAVLGGLFIAMAWVLRRFWVTLGWVVVFAFALSKDVESLSSVPYRALGVAVLLVVLLVLSRRFGGLRKVLPVVAEVSEHVVRRGAESATGCCETSGSSPLTTPPRIGRSSLAGCGRSMPRSPR